MSVEASSRAPNWLDRACALCALAGGAVLTALALMSVASIAGRALFSQPLQGDYELVQTGCAVFVALCLPYCQSKRANIIVDFFTANASRARRSCASMRSARCCSALVMLLLAWRTGVGLDHACGRAARPRRSSACRRGGRTPACCRASRSPRSSPFATPSGSYRRLAPVTSLGIGLLLFGAMLVADGVARADRDRDVRARRGRLRRAVERDGAPQSSQGRALRALLGVRPVGDPAVPADGPVRDARAGFRDRCSRSRAR